MPAFTRGDDHNCNYGVATLVPTFERSFVAYCIERDTESETLLTVRPDSTRTELILEGAYEPPFGLVGQVFDGLLGKQIAHGTVRALLRQIATSIEGQWQHYVSTMPDIESLNLRSGV